MKTKTFRVAVVLIAVFITLTGLSLQATSAARQTAQAHGRPPILSEQELATYIAKYTANNTGLMKLLKGLKKGYEKSKINKSQVNEVMRLVRTGRAAKMLNDGLIADLAREFKNGGAKHYQNLLTSLKAATQDTVTVQSDCGQDAQLYFWGCVDGGGGWGNCSYLADRQYCGCCCGYYDPNSGLCF